MLPHDLFFTDLLILLVFVWVSRKIFRALRLPPLFGEIMAGVIAGPVLLGWVEETEAIKVLAELGIFFLLFHSGLESEPKDLLRSSKRAIFVVLGGTLLTMLGAFLVAQAFDYDFATSLFIGMNLSVTAVAVSTRLFKDSKLSQSEVAHTVMGAAVMEEVLILVAFSIFVNIQETGEFDPRMVVETVLKSIAYFAVVFYVGHRYFKDLYKIIYKGNKGFTFSIIIALLLAVGAEAIGLHFIIGAFLGGLFLHAEIFDEKVFNKIEDRTFGMSYSFLAPIFFATLAFNLDFSAFVTAPLFMASILVVAMLGKIVGCGLGARFAGLSKNESLGVGLGMNSRGAVDLILATLALEAGIINSSVFSVLVLVSFASTLVTIFLMKPVAKKLRV
jgi:Kef-type K+ transport system membrane component KefB